MHGRAFARRRFGPGERRGERLMPFDIFGLRDRVVGEYQRCVKSFINIRDPKLLKYVTERLDERLWRDRVLQLNPPGDARAAIRRCERFKWTPKVLKCRAESEV